MAQRNTVVIGGGQTGLALSYCLRQRGVDHVVLERGEIGQRWRTERWDSLTLLTPNWATQLPGFHYDGANPDGYDTRDEYVAYLERYAASSQAPVQTRTEARRVERSATADGYRIETSRGTIEARNVVVATGPFHEPFYPEARSAVSDGITQLHSSQYRNAAQLPSGAALVVGGGNSGLQIVEDLLRAGRRVYAATGRMRAAPRRYRGKDIIWWLIQLGALDRRVEDLPSPEAKNVPPPLLTGVGGGHDLSPNRLAEQGTIFLGRLLGGANDRLVFATDINETFAKSAEAFHGFKQSIDQYIDTHGLEAPEEAHDPRDEAPFQVADPLGELDLRAEGVSSVIWATGFRTTFDWVHLPVIDDAGEPVHRGGVTDCPGFYFLGLRWLRKYKSLFIYGAGEDAAILADHIAER